MNISATLRKRLSSTTLPGRRRLRGSALSALILFVLLASACSAGAPAALAAETGKPVHLKIGVSPVPHGEIFRFVIEHLAADAGLELTLIEFTDYVQPNLALRDGQIDANFFQHTPYMEDFGAEHGFEMVALAAVHIEPLGIYSRKGVSLADVPDGAVVAIPNDATNGGRALRLLAANGLITLREGADFAATVQDIAANPKGLVIRELDAAQLPRSLDDTTLSVINGNFALDAGLSPADDALALEAAEDNPYTNVLTVLKERADEPGLLKLAELLTSPEVKAFLEENYAPGSVIPAF